MSTIDISVYLKYYCIIVYVMNNTNLESWAFVPFFLKEYFLLTITGTVMYSGS